MVHKNGAEEEQLQGCSKSFRFKKNQKLIGAEALKIDN